MAISLEDARKIKITDKPLFDKYFREFKPEISELTFTNLFIWSTHYEFLFTEFSNHLLIFSKTYLNKWKKPQSDKKGLLYFIPPIGQNPEQIILQLLKKFDNIEFHKVPKTIVNQINEQKLFHNMNITILEDRDNWDYLYNKEDLISLPGNKYRNKRRWLAKFLEEYNYDFQILDEDLIEKARQLQLEWCILNECQSNEDLTEEQKAIDTIFDHYSDLNIIGGILCVEEKCAGYTLGEMLNDDTIVIHIEKAHRDFQGSYQAINNLFLKNCCEEADYVNREQDLGIPGLRKAKETYNPIHMVKKYIIY